MGVRANFVIVEDGRASLYYSRWAATTLLPSIFYGLELAASYIKDLAPTDYLLDDVWCEGAAVVDRDTRCLLFYVCDMRYGPGLLRYFLPLLRYNWPGWEVSWADQGIVDIALRLGIDPAEVRNKLESERRFELLDLAAEPAYVLTIVTVRGAAGATDCGFEERLFNVLAHGPGLLDQLGGRAEVSLVEDENLESGAFVDPERKEVWAWHNGVIEDRDLAKVAGFWPGWTLIRQDGGLCEQVRLSGRDTSKLDLTADRAVRELAALLFEDIPFAPSKVLDSLPPEERGEGLQIGRGFFDVDRPEFGEDATRQMFRRAVAALRAGEIRPEPVKTRGRVVVPAKEDGPSTPGPG